MGMNTVSKGGVKVGRVVQGDNAVSKTASWTVTSADNGRLFLIGAADLVATLPSVFGNRGMHQHGLHDHACSGRLHRWRRRGRNGRAEPAEHGRDGYRGRCRLALLRRHRWLDHRELARDVGEGVR